MVEADPEMNRGEREADTDVLMKRVSLSVKDEEEGDWERVAGGSRPGNMKASTALR